VSVSSNVLTLAYTGTQGASVITVSAIDSAGNSVRASFSVSLETTTYSAWRHQYFTAEQLADTGLGDSLWGDFADPDGDGIANLMEYALGLSPVEADPGINYPAIGTDRGGVVVRYRKLIEAATDPRISAFLESTPSLIAAEWEPLTIDAAVKYSEQDYKVYEMLLPEAETLFVRFRVTLVN